MLEYESNRRSAGPPSLPLLPAIRNTNSPRYGLLPFHAQSQHANEGDGQSLTTSHITSDVACHQAKGQIGTISCTLLLTIVFSCPSLSFHGATLDAPQQRCTCSAYRGTSHRQTVDCITNTPTYHNIHTSTATTLLSTHQSSISSPSSPTQPLPYSSPAAGQRCAGVEASQRREGGAVRQQRG